MDFTPEEIAAIKVGLPMFLKFRDLQAIQAKFAAVQAEKDKASSAAQSSVNEQFDVSLAELRNMIVTIQEELSSLLKG